MKLWPVIVNVALVLFVVALCLFFMFRPSGPRDGG